MNDNILPIRPSKRILGGRYELRTRLGIGGMARVFLAWDLLLQREVAVKILRSELAQDPYEVSRFLIEGQLLARVSSERIVQIYDMHTDETQSYLVLQHLTGHTLEELCRIRPFSTVDACDLVRDVLVALDDLHGVGVLHRDVKPSNILVCSDQRAILLDLGVAKDRESPGFTRVDHAIGTPCFMSPEQQSGAQLDERSDLYQVGLLLLSALTGHDPIRHDDPTVSLARLPSGIREVVERAISPRPSARYASANEMREALQRVCNRVETIPVEVVRTTDIIVETEPAPPSRRRKRRPWKAMVFPLATMLVAALGWNHASQAAPALSSAPAIRAPLHEATHLEIEGTALEAHVAGAEISVPPIRSSPKSSPDVPRITTDPILRQARIDEQNGAMEPAIAAYRRYLRQHPDSADATWVRRHLTELQGGRLDV